MYMLKEKGADIQKLVATGCDGTVTNTGKSGDVMRLLEEVG